MKNINIYVTDELGYITEIKSVKENYVMGVGDYLGIPDFKEGQHYQTGLERPKTQEQLDTERVTELKKIIDDKRYIGDDVTAEQNELRTLLGY